MKKAIKKSIASAALLAILIFSFMAYVSPLASADPIGIGKYVSVNIAGGQNEENPGTVTLLKLSSGESWEFPLSTGEDNNVDIENNRVKVGAGDVQLIADANDELRYEFSHWEDEQGATIKDEQGAIVGDIYEFKTSKGTTIVTAVFQLITYKIKYYVNVGGGGGISLTNNPEDAVYTQWPEFETVEVSFGESQKFWFFPDENHFVSAIIIDNGKYVVPLESGFGSWYEFANVKEDHELNVTFSAVGEEIPIPSGAVTLYVGEGASLTFGSSSGGTATATIIEDFPAGTAFLVWDIHNTAIDNADGKVTITFYSVDSLEEVIVANSLNATYCDVNRDGIIDGADVSAVANAVKSTTPNGDFDPLYDVNNDGDLTEDDVHRVNEHKWEVVLYLTPTQIPNTNYYEVETDHFSVFRAR